MITRFRKGQQIRQNDLNNIINGLTGRMIGGPGVNVRKMAGNVVLDAEDLIKNTRGSQLIIGDIIKFTLDLEPVKSQLYGFHTEYRLPERQIIANAANHIFVYSEDNIIRKIRKHNLSIDAQVSPSPAFPLVPNDKRRYKGIAYDGTNVFISYAKYDGLVYRLATNKYDADLNLINTEYLHTGSADNQYLAMMTGTNDSADYVVSWNFIHSKNITGITEIDMYSSIQELEDYTNICNVFCGETEIYATYPTEPFLDNTCTLVKLDLSGNVTETFLADVNSSESVISSGLWVDGADVFFSASTQGQCKIYRLNSSLSLQDSVDVSTYSGISSGDIAISAIASSSDSIYCISSRFNGYLLKVKKTDLSLEAKWLYDDVLRGISSDGNNIYVTGFRETE